MVGLDVDQGQRGALGNVEVNAAIGLCALFSTVRNYIEGKRNQEEEQRWQ